MLGVAIILGLLYFGSGLRYATSQIFKILDKHHKQPIGVAKEYALITITWPKHMHNEYKQSQHVEFRQTER